VIFENFPIDDAEGCLLAHTLRTPNWVIKKGTRLDTDRIRQLHNAGIEKVMAARLVDGDVPEDEAALLIARKFVSGGVSVKEPQAGRCNLYADCRGIVIIDRNSIDQFNLLGRGVMVGTVAPFKIVEQGDVVATIKVIPYAVRAPDLEAQQAVINNKAIQVQPFKHTRTGLVLTRSAGQKEGLHDKARKIMTDRLESWGGQLDRVEKCNHDLDEVAALVSGMGCENYDLILVMGATSPSDAADVVPAAIEKAGGRLEQVGIPVEPGNMMVLGALGTIPVVGLPGCARSQCLNGIDLVLPRLMAGLPVEAADLMRLGVGGLLE
jgi:molybdenum cofactor cytidylyltransferase